LKPDAASRKNGSYAKVSNRPLIAIGRIIGPHGVKGEIKLFSYAESIEPFVPGVSLLLKRHDGKKGKYAIVSARPHKKGGLLKLEGINSIDEVNAWRDAEVFLQTANLKGLDEGAYYWFQVIGLKVVTVDHKFLGKITNIIRTGSNDVYVVRNQSEELLIPAIESVIVEIDLDKQVVRVDLPEGLLDL
jgi:16S rRNA processing protein RimM